MTTTQNDHARTASAGQDSSVSRGTDQPPSFRERINAVRDEFMQALKDGDEAMAKFLRSAADECDPRKTPQDDHVRSSSTTVDGETYTEDEVRPQVAGQASSTEDPDVDALREAASRGRAYEFVCELAVREADTKTLQRELMRRQEERMKEIGGPVPNPMDEAWAAQAFQAAKEGRVGKFITETLESNEDEVTDAEADDKNEVGTLDRDAAWRETGDTFLNAAPCVTSAWFDVACDLFEYMARQVDATIDDCRERIKAAINTEPDVITD